MVTRKEVAEYAGVSQATVSNVINNKNIVSSEVKARVVDAIKTLQYRPNMVARSLKTKETMQVALIINDISNQYYAEVALGMEWQAREAGYVVCIINAGKDSSYMDEVLKRQFDGIIMATDKIPIENINSLANMNIPIVFAGNREYKDMDNRITHIQIDTYKGAYELFEYLVSQGHKNIAFISARALGDIEDMDYRLKAYKDVLLKHKISLDPSLIFFKEETLDYAYHAACEAIKKENRPTAIFAGNDYLSIAVMAAARDARLKVPKDLSIVGFDNLSSSKYYSPPLTTVDMPKHMLGKKAMELLVRKMAGEAVAHIVIPTCLVIRESTT